jgi:MFS family permease
LAAGLTAQVNLRLVVLLTVLVHLAFAGSRVTLPLLAIHLDASPFTVGVIMSLLAALPMLFSVYAGRVIDRVGARRPMILGAGSVVAGMLLAVAMPELQILFAVSALVGSGFILFHIAVNHAVGVSGQPRDRARNFSMLALAFSTSNFIGPIIAGFAIDGIGHRLTFLLLSLSALAALAIITASRSDTPRHHGVARAGERRHFADLLRNPALRNVFIVSAMLSMAWDLFTFVTPIHGSRIGLSATVIGIILGAFGAAIFAVRLILPFFVHRVSEWRMLVIAMFSSGAMLAVFPLITSVPLLVGLAFLLGVGLGGAQPMIMALLYNRAPPGRGGEAVGVRTLLLNFSQAGIPLLFGAMGATLGMAPVFWTMALALAAGGWRGRRSS